MDSAIKKMKTLLFSITKKDFDVQTFRSGGAGGQNQNKVSSGVRVIHKDSGAVGVARDSRDQHQNKKNAFLRCVESKTFKDWMRIEISRRTNEYADAEAKVNKMMQPKYLKAETLTDRGWKLIEEQQSVA